VLPVLVGMSQFERQVNMRFFFKLQKSSTETLVGLGAVYGEKALKNLVTGLAFLNMPFIKNCA
jgi:hypothetical protein